MSDVLVPFTVVEVGASVTVAVVLVAGAERTGERRAAYDGPVG